MEMILDWPTTEAPMTLSHWEIHLPSRSHQPSGSWATVLLRISNWIKGAAGAVPQCATSTLNRDFDKWWSHHGTAGLWHRRLCWTLSEPQGQMDKPCKWLTCLGAVRGGGRGCLQQPSDPIKGCMALKLGVCPAALSPNPTWHIDSCQIDLECSASLSFV